MILLKSFYPITRKNLQKIAKSQTSKNILLIERHLEDVVRVKRRMLWQADTTLEYVATFGRRNKSRRRAISSLKRGFVSVVNWRLQKGWNKDAMIILFY